jgi:hypothetical protein
VERCHLRRRSARHELRRELPTAAVEDHDRIAIVQAQHVGSVMCRRRRQVDSPADCQVGIDEEAGARHGGKEKGRRAGPL